MTKKLSPVKIFDLLACGKLVLATPLDGLLYDFPKESDILIYSDLNDFESQIIYLLNNNILENYGNKGRKFVEENYTWENVTNLFLNNFKSFLEHNSKLK